MEKDFLRDGINKMRKMICEHEELNSKMQLNEDYETQDTNENEPTDAVPYTTNDEMFNSIIEVCKERFGANFTKIKHPMLFFPGNDTIQLTGISDSLEGNKFRYTYGGSDAGCYVWGDPLKITDDTLKVLYNINGVYKNWVDKDLKNKGGDIKPMSLRDEGVLGEDNGLVPGDDLD